MELNDAIRTTFAARDFTEGNRQCGPSTPTLWIGSRRAEKSKRVDQRARFGVGHLPRFNLSGPVQHLGRQGPLRQGQRRHDSRCGSRHPEPEAR